MTARHCVGDTRDESGGIANSKHTLRCTAFIPRQPGSITLFASTCRTLLKMQPNIPSLISINLILKNLVKIYWLERPLHRVQQLEAWLAERTFDRLQRLPSAPFPARTWLQLLNCTPRLSQRAKHRLISHHSVMRDRRCSQRRTTHKN